jgi:hypothetical protein
VQVDEHRFSPDGLTADDITYLVAESLTSDAPRLTSALLDGTALARRLRREAQRQLGGTVRVLRVHGFKSVQTGTEAA